MLGNLWQTNKKMPVSSVGKAFRSFDGIFIATCDYVNIFEFGSILLGNIILIS